MPVKVALRLPSSPNGERIELNDDWLIKDLPQHLAQQVGKDPSTFAFLYGHPPKSFTDEELDKKVPEVLKRGDALTVTDPTKNPEDNIKQGKLNGKYVPPIEVRNSIFVKHDVPGDNSCLFHSVGWIFDMPANDVRKMVSALIPLNPEKYTSGFLGSSPAAYCQWILQPSSWGGAIEIDLLSDVFRCEICVLDMTSKKPQVFGQGKDFTTRAFVVYTGNHYDGGGVGSSMEGAAKLQKIFNSRDERPMLIADDYLQGRVKAGKA